MNKKIVFLGVAFIMLAVFIRAATITGSCSSSGRQCDLSVEEFTLCNDAPAQTYYISAEGEKASWFNVIPSRVMLREGECTQLRVYIVAGCYDLPGNYTAEIIVKPESGALVSLPCFFELEQGHLVDVEITPPQQAATQCEEKSYLIVLTNESTTAGQQSERVRLRLDGLPPGWYEFEKTELLVSKGKPERVGLSVRAPCTAEFGEYPFEIAATLLNPDFASFDSAVYILQQGQGIIIDAADRYDACLEEAGLHALKITNAGKLDDRIKLELEGPSWVSLDSSELEFGVGETKELHLNFAKNNAPPDKYAVTITAKSLIYNYESETHFDVYLSDCYKLAVEKLAGPEVACAEDRPSYVFGITNNALRDIEFEAAIKGIGAALSQDKILLRPGERTELEAVLDVSNPAGDAPLVQRNVAVEMVMDSSGSMLEKVNGYRKIDAVKDAITYFVNNITNVDFGLRIFGQEEGCTESALIVGVSKLNVAEITEKMEGFSPKGMAPIAAALGKAPDDLSAGDERYIILVSGGRETCGGNLGAAAAAIAKAGIRVYAVGFGIDAAGKDQLEMIAAETGGLYFDASNAEELLDIFRQLTKEIGITPSTTSKKKFSLELKSEKFSYHAEYELLVEDCHNITVIPPVLNLCRGVPANEFITVSNLGTRRQLITVDIEPSWVEGDRRIDLAPHSSALIPIAINTSEDAAEEQITVSVTSEKASSRNSRPINYLSIASCFSVDLRLPVRELDAWACEGRAQSLIVENKGRSEQTVSFSADVPWVYFDQQKLKLGSGESKESYFLIAPPLDLEEGANYITISLETDRGFKSKAAIRLNVLGGQPRHEAAGPLVDDINLTRLPSEKGVDAEVEFQLRNDSNRTMSIFSLESQDFNASFELGSSVIDKNGRTSVRMYIDLPEGYSGKEVVAPIKVKTGEGTFIRTIQFILPLQEGVDGNETQDINAGEEIPTGTGFAGLFTFEGIRNIIIILLFLVVVWLVIYSILSGQGAAGDRAKTAPSPKTEETKKKPAASAKKKK